MALQGTFQDMQQPAARTLRRARASERDRAFARARRHTGLVRVLRIALPAIALLAVASYGIGVQMSFRVANGKIDVGSIAVTTQNLTMSNPRYEGFNKDGSRFSVTAKTAVQDLKQQEPVALNDITGKLIQANDTTIDLAAPRGSFDHKANRLELFDDIKIRGSDGMRADLKQATVLTKENRITSNQPVAIDMAAGQVRANEMVIEQTSRQVTFSNGVITRLRPEKKPVDPAAAPQPSSSRLLGGSDAPVDITSRTLVVDDNKKLAVFSGEVLAKQGDASLSGPELHAYYEGTQNRPGAAAQPGAGKLTRIVVPANVVMTQGTDKVTSDTAEFDASQDTAALVGHVVMDSGPNRRASSDRADLDSHADIALLTGNVSVTQDRNVLKGARLYLDRRGGISKLSTPAPVAGQPAGRISARFFQNASAKPAVNKKAGQPAAVASGFVFRTDPDAPIDIDAETLDVLDRSKTATFHGAVRAVQGDFTIKTPELVASYSGEAGFATQSRAAGTPQAGAQLTRVRANQHVEVTGSDQTAIGDWADFDIKGNTVTIGVSTAGGHVLLKKGNSISYAPKAIIDLTTGLTFLQQETRSGPAVSASPTEQRAPYALPDLPAKKAAAGAPVAPGFDTDPTKCTRAVCLKFDPKDGLTQQAPAGKVKPAAKPWQTETTPQKAKPPEPSGWTSPQPSAN